MSEEYEDTLDYLRACTIASVSRGSMWDVEMCTKAIRLIERLEAEAERKTEIAILAEQFLDDAKKKNAAMRAEVERLTPREMDSHEAVKVLDEFRYLGETGWYVSSGGKVRCGQHAGYINGFEAIAVAEKLRRDAGPTAEREPANPTIRKDL